MEAESSQTPRVLLPVTAWVDLRHGAKLRKPQLDVNIAGAHSQEIPRINTFTGVASRVVAAREDHVGGDRFTVQLHLGDDKGDLELSSQHF